MYENNSRFIRFREESVLKRRDYRLANAVSFSRSLCPVTVIYILSLLLTLGITGFEMISAFNVFRVAISLNKISNFEPIPPTKSFCRSPAKYLVVNLPL